MNKALVKSSLLISLFILTGCDEQKYISENLANQWIDAFRQYQIHPTFTAREDIQVGDLILTCDLSQLNKSTNDKRYLPISTLLARFNVNQKLDEFYKSSVKLPSTKSVSSTQAANASIALKNAAFPDFLTAQISGADIGAALPAGKVMAGFGISTKDIRSVSISVPSIGSYQLPISDLLSSIGYFEAIKAADTAKTADTKQFAEKYKSLLHLKDYIRGFAETNCNSSQPVFMLVSEVFAAHGLNVDINLSSAAAANIKAAINISDSKSKLDLIKAFGSIFGIPSQSDTTEGAKDSDASAAAKVADGTGKTPTAEPEGSSAKPNETSRLDDFKEYLELVTEKSDANSDVGYPGVKISTYSGSFAGISIERRFDSPVVIGVKGVDLALAKCGYRDVAKKDGFYCDMCSETESKPNCKVKQLPEETTPVK